MQNPTTKLLLYEAPMPAHSFTVGQVVRIVSTGRYDDTRIGSIGNLGYVSLSAGVTGIIFKEHNSKWDSSPVFQPTGWPLKGTDYPQNGFVISPELLEVWDGELKPCEIFDMKAGKRIPKSVADVLAAYEQEKQNELKGG